MFKECEDLVGGVNQYIESTLRWLANLEEEEWEGILLILEEVSFDAGRNL